MSADTLAPLSAAHKHLLYNRAHSATYDSVDLSSNFSRSGSLRMTRTPINVEQFHRNGQRTSSVRSNKPATPLNRQYPLHLTEQQTFSRNTSRTSSAPPDRQQQKPKATDDHNIKGYKTDSFMLDDILSTLKERTKQFVEGNHSEQQNTSELLSILERGIENVSTNVSTPAIQTNTLFEPVSKHSQPNSCHTRNVADAPTRDSSEIEGGVVLDAVIKGLPSKEQNAELAQAEKMLDKICNDQAAVSLTVPAITYDKNIFINLPERDQKPYKFEELIAHLKNNPHIIDLINLDVLEDSVKLRNYAVTVLLLRCSGMPTVGYQPATGTKRVDINKLTKNGQTLLQMACKQGQLNMVKLLIDAGADVLTIDEQTGNTALHLGFLHGDQALIEYLLNTQAQFITTVVNHQKKTPLDVLLKNINFPKMRPLMINSQQARSSYKPLQRESILNDQQTVTFENTLLILERFIYDADLKQLEQSSTTYTAL